MDWIAVSAYAAGGSAGAVAGWLAARRFPRWRFELRTGLVTAGLLVAGFVVVPRAHQASARAELRATGLELFGDSSSADHYVSRMFPLRQDSRLRQKARSGLAAVGYAGMARLSLAELETSLAVRRRLSDASPVVCAGMWRGGLAGSDLAAALRRLSPADKRSWIDITARAAELELAADGPPASISNLQAARAWSILLARLPESSRAVIDRTSKAGASASPDDACEAFRIVASEAAALAPGDRDTLVRVVTCPFLVARAATPRGSR